MQVAHVKQAAKPKSITKGYDSALSQKTDETKPQESNVAELQKLANFKRMFEACNDCV